jgi:hypothetical protein
MDTRKSGGTSMKKESLFLSFPLCLLLGALAGCSRPCPAPGPASTPPAGNKPVNAVVLLPDPKEGPPAVYAEQGGTLEFRSEMPSFTVTMSDPSPCSEGSTLSGTSSQPAICTIAPDVKLRKYAYTITVNRVAGEKPPTKARKKKGGGQKLQPPPFHGVMYVRGCHQPCLK